MCQLIFAQSDYYWVGGTGSWSDLNHWRIGSATGPQATIIPSRYDNVFFLNGSGVVSGTSGTCKDFTMDNSFSGQVSFGYNALDVYGNFKWGANATLNCTNLNLYSEGTNPTPAIVDVANPFRVDYTASLAINFLGTGSFNLLNDFSAIAYNGSFPSGGAARVSFNIKDSAVLMTNNKNISVYAGFNYSSTSISDFGTSGISSVGTITFNSNANLTQATLTAQSFSFPTTQNVKKITCASGSVNTGLYLKVDEMTMAGSNLENTIVGTGVTQYEINTLNLLWKTTIGRNDNPSNYIANLKVNTLNATATTANGSIFNARQNDITNFVLSSGNCTFNQGNYNIDNLTLNGGQYTFNNINGTYYFKINQNITANPSCSGTIAYLNSTNLNLQMPSSINGGTTVNFPGYKFLGIRLTGGASVTAAVDGGNNTGNISYTGVTAKTFYRIGGGGNWYDGAKWSLDSVNRTPANCVPTIYDDVIFDAGSGFTVGNNTITSSNGAVGIRNMNWSNAPGNPVYNLDATTIYGNLKLQKDMVATAASFIFFKYNMSSPPENRYMNFEGQKIKNLFMGSHVYNTGYNWYEEVTAPYINDNFYLQPAGWAAFYDVDVIGDFVFNTSSTPPATTRSNMIADGVKINVGGGLYMGGNSVSFNNSLVQTNKMYVATYQPITATGASVYISGNYQGKQFAYTNANHYFENFYKTGTAGSTFSDVKSNLFQVNTGGAITMSGITTNTFNVNSGTTSLSFSGTANQVKDFNVNAGTNFTIAASSSLRVTDTFVYNRADCDNVMNFTGSGGNNFILGNNINGNGFVELNRMDISGINAIYVTPIAGAKPVNANNSIDSGNNSGINFTIPIGKNFYWKGGSGNWNDISHWSLDPTSARLTSTCGIPTIYDNVFFDQYSGLSSMINSIILSGDIYVNDMIFSGISSSNKTNFGQAYKVNINGDLTLYGGIDNDQWSGNASTFNQFYFINSFKPAGTNKAVYPNGALTVNFNFTGNANWKIYHGTGASDFSGNVIQSITVGTLDLSNVVATIWNGSFNGKEVLLDGTNINTTAFRANTQQPIISNNSILKLSYPSFGANDLAHYFERIDLEVYNINTQGYFILPNGTINNFNILEGRFYTPNAYHVNLNLKNVNRLTIQKTNIINLEAPLTVHQSMLLQGDCLQTNRLQINGRGKQLILPNYNTTDYIINKVQLTNISSSGGQTYMTSGSKNLGNVTGFSFPDAVTSTPRDMYWIGGTGEWSDASHWSLSSGGAPITTCDPPRSIDNVFFDQNSGGGTVSLTPVSYANNLTIENNPVFAIGATSNDYMLNIYGSLTVKGPVTMSPYRYAGIIHMLQGTVTGRTRYIDTNGRDVRHIVINAQDNFELLSAFSGNSSFNASNVKSFKTNNYPLTISPQFNGISFNYDQNINPLLDFGASVINTGSYGFSITSNNLYPVTINAVGSKMTTCNFVINIPNVSNFGEVTIKANTPSILNSGATVHNFNKVTFLGDASITSTLASRGNYKTLYFNPGNYAIASGQTVTENLFMTGTPCNRINIGRIAASGQSAINLDPAAAYTMFYASVKDINFSRPVSAYGNSQDLGNTTNLTIVPTNVQAAGFGGNKTLCTSEFPKTYDAAALFGTDPNATYTWTKLNAPNAGVISNSPIVTFTQAGSYSVKVVYAQDGCNITEKFTISSVTLPVDNTATTSVSALVNPTGDVTVTFKGSLSNQAYIFTYSINNGPDLEVTSNANGVATVNHPRNVVGTFVYHLKGVRFVSGMACPVVIHNKDVVVNINPACPTPGVINLYGSELRGCTESTGARRLAEVSQISIANPPTETNVTKLISGTGIVIKEGTDVFLLRNNDVASETLTLPSNRPHAQGAIIYHNDHFYEGVENGRWIRIDND